METFDSHWLALRRRVDHRSRSEDLVRSLSNWWTSHAAARVVDLGSGTGSNLQYLAPRLSGRQDWTLIDHDPQLLREAKAPAGQIKLDCLVGNLADVGLSAIHNADVVTASALLDLVSAEWLETVANACADARCAVLFSLTYDGTIEWTSRDIDPADSVVLAAVNEHQHRDKGLGPALGPGASRFAEKLLRHLGFQTWTAYSPWRLGPEDSELVYELVSGWQAAATQQEPDQKDEIWCWADRRRAMIASGSFELRVGHIDLLGLPPY